MQKKPANPLLANISGRIQLEPKYRVSRESIYNRSMSRSGCPDSPSTTMDLDRGGVAMESLTDQREFSHPPAAAAASVCPRLVLLPRFIKHTDDFSAVADAKTTSAASCTSTGRCFHVSFGLVPSTEISSFCATAGRIHRPPTAASSCPLSSLLTEIASC